MIRHRSSLLLKFVLIVGLLAGAVGFIVCCLRPHIDDPLAQGVSAYEREEWSRAEGHARAALKTARADPKALQLLARSLARQGRDPSAEAIYRRVGTKVMDTEDYFLLGRGLLSRGLVEPALASLGAARDIQPDHAETLDALSRYWANAHAMTDAIEATERLARQAGWEVRGEVRLGRLRSQLFDPGGAAAVLADALARDSKLIHADLGPGAARRLLARSLLQVGRPAEARAQLLDSSGGELDPEGAWLLSRVFLQEGKVVDAIAALKEAKTFGKADPMLPEPAPFLGAARCAACHKGEFQSQQSSRHSRTLVRTTGLPGLPWPHGIIRDTDNPEVEHQFRRTETQVEIVTEVKNQAFRAVLEFAMGSNRQGQSFLASVGNGEVRELRISHYPGAPQWSRTNEHPVEPPDPPGYLGRPISTESFRRCLHCHSTNFRAVLVPEGRLEAGDHGIGCERCHGPAGNHPAAVAASFPELAIARPKLASSSRIVALCGECHTAPAKKTADDPGFVRFQSSGLVLSRCYTESRESFSCITCHDPHKDVETSAKFYESRCLKCHALSPRSTDWPEPTPSVRGPSCRVRPLDGCLDCHMSRAKDAIPRAIFTDHYIRIKRD